MAEKHPGAKYFGDTCSGTLDGEMVSQICQLCGEELIAEDTILPELKKLLSEMLTALAAGFAHYARRNKATGEWLQGNFCPGSWGYQWGGLSLALGDLLNEIACAIKGADYMLRRFGRWVQWKLSRFDVFWKQGWGIYCPRCGACGEEGCCPASLCDHGLFCAGYYEEEQPMDYLKLAGEALGPAPSVEGSYLAEERRDYAKTCALIAIAEQLCKLNENLGNLGFAVDASLTGRGYVPPV